MKRREYWIDIARGYACILVVVGHVIGGLPNIGGGVQNELRQNIYLFHMPLFFMISGLTTNFQVQNDCGIKKKIKKIISIILTFYIPYLVWGYIFWAVKYFIYAGNEPVTITDAFLLPVNYNAWIPGWFLIALGVIKIIDLIFWWLNIPKSIQAIVWIILLLIGYWNIPFIGGAFVHGINYFVGKIVGTFDESDQFLKKMTFDSLFVLLLAAILYNSKCLPYFSKFLIGVSISIILLSFIKHVNPDIYWLKKIGQYSMITYVLHGYFSVMIRILLDKLTVDLLWIYVILETFGCMICIYGVIRLAERFNIVKKLFYPS